MRTTKSLAVLAAFAVLALVAAGPAAAKDRNDDGIPDRWEKRHNLSLKKNQAKRDQDKDGLRNKGEFRAKTDPRDEDTDDDGVEDGNENAGTIESYDAATGMLTINVFNGDTVTGLVTEDTEIECGCRGDAEDDDDAQDRRHPDETDDDGNSGPGPNSGPGNQDGEDVGRCSTDVLVPGAPVHEAELELSGGGLLFTEIEMVKDDEDESDDDSDDDDSDDDSDDDDGSDS